MIKVYQTDIKKIYENIRQEEQHLLKKRQQEISEKFPRISEIERQIGALCLNLSITILKDPSNKDNSLAKLKEKITDLRMEKTELLVQNGYSMNYLELQYRCPKCKDTGFIGKEPCICYKHKLVNLYYERSELKEILQYNNFDYFNFDYYSTKKSDGEPESPRRNIEKTLSKLQDFIANFDKTSENFLFYGSSGTGKTFLSHCTAKELLDKGYFVVYRTAESLIQNLRNIKFNGDSMSEELLLDCDLLIVDDLGTEQISDFSLMELFNLLNKKLLLHKKMLFSTNYALEDLLKIYSERITSRLFGNFTVCKFYGEDIRIKKKYQK